MGPIRIPELTVKVKTPLSIHRQSINQFFNYRNVKTHFHMRQTQSSKVYVKSVNTYHYNNILMIKLQSVNREAR